jgi:putative ABC transport system permease protein
MLKNYLKIAIQNLIRHKGYAFINIAGFAVGMACCLLIVIYISQELSYDRYHQDEERIYRIVLDIRKQTSNREFALVSPTVAPVLKRDYQQVEQSARILKSWTPRLVKQNEKKFFEERFMYADPELFDIFTIPVIRGNVRKSLTRPDTLVISKRMAGKYFGDADPIGKILEINNQPFEVTAVIRNSPENTHLKYDLIASMATLKDWSEMSNWHSTMFYTYLKLKPGVNPDTFSKQVSRLADPHVGELLKNWETVYHYSLQPLAGIHLTSHLGYETEPPGNLLYITVFLFVGLFILIIACLNFVNLSTARAGNRAREVGVRKVVGAQKRQLITQFSGESLLMVFLSLGAAMILAAMAIPHLNEWTGLNLDFDILLSPGICFFILGGTFILGMAAGLYPAFVLSAFRPVVTLKGNPDSGSGGVSLRKALVVIQFAISAILIIGTVTMYRQFNFMKNQHLGFKKEQKLVLPLRGGIDIKDNFRTVKNRFLGHPSIYAATVSSTVPGRPVSNFSIKLVGEDDPKSQSMYHLYFDEDFIPEYGISVVAGRAFRKEFKTDFMGGFLINQAAVKAFGWNSPEEAIGKRLQTGHGVRINPIIGVTGDFHYRGLQSRVEPLVMEFLPWSFRYITLSINISDLSETLAFVKNRWKSMWPDYPFDYFFLDSDFDHQYRADEQMGNLLGIFTFLGLVIACMGLLGLVAFTVRQRRKEIGIRKILGASASGLTFKLSLEFLKWVVLANIIAWPVAYILMRNWLQGFAYQAKLGLDVFVISGLVAMVIALLTVSYQSIRAAAANPVDSLRYE